MSEIKNAIPEINNTLGRNSRLDETEDGISDLEDKVGKTKTLGQSTKKKKEFKGFQEQL